MTLKYLAIALALLIVLAIPLAIFIDWRKRHVRDKKIWGAIESPPKRNKPLPDKVMALTKKCKAVPTGAPHVET